MGADMKQKALRLIKKVILVTVLFWLLVIGYVAFTLIRNGYFVSEWSAADSCMKKIVAAVNDRDADALKAIFSAKALNECEDWDTQANEFFEFVEGNIISWEFRVIPSDDEMANGKRWLMVRASVYVQTDVEKYVFFFIHYPVDTFDKSNKGLYMLEVHKHSYSGEWRAWQDRMRAGLAIIQ